MEHSIIVRQIPPGVAFKRKDGLMLMYKTKKTFYEYWLKVYKKGEHLTSKSPLTVRQNHLDECIDCYSWFVLRYAQQPNNCSDLEILTFTEYYEIYLSHYLACDTVIVANGGKHGKNISNLLANIHKVDYLWNITKLIVEHHQIDWIKFDGATISLKYD